MFPLGEARVLGRCEIFGKMLSTRALWFGGAVLVAAALAAACGEDEQEQRGTPQPPTSTATAARTAVPTPSPSAPSATPTGSKTPSPTPETAAYDLECVVVNVKLGEPLPANVYAPSGTFVPTGATQPGTKEVAGLRVEITGEAGEAVRSGEPSTNADYQGNLTVTIDEERTYSASQHTYTIVGNISYSISDLGTIADYDITATGGGFGTASKTCGKP
jgi:hypothetical protein